MQNCNCTAAKYYDCGTQFYLNLDGTNSIHVWNLRNKANSESCLILLLDRLNGTWKNFNLSSKSAIQVPTDSIVRRELSAVTRTVKYIKAFGMNWAEEKNSIFMLFNIPVVKHSPESNLRCLKFPRPIYFSRKCCRWKSRKKQSSKMSECVKSARQFGWAFDEIVLQANKVLSQIFWPRERNNKCSSWFLSVRKLSRFRCKWLDNLRLNEGEENQGASLFIERKIKLTLEVIATWMKIQFNTR